MGPITEWNVSGFDGGEGTVIGIATVYAEYKLLGNPSQEYSPFMISIREKVRGVPMVYIGLGSLLTLRVGCCLIL
jgi:hypothetical protein